MQVKQHSISPPTIYKGHLYSLTSAKYQLIFNLCLYVVGEVDSYF